MSSLVIAIFLLSIGASFVQRTTGFGFGIFIMTMLPFFLPTYGEATTLSGLLAITTSAVIVWRMRGYVTWKRLWPILLTFIVVSTIAIFALTRIEDHILKRILGVALIVISIYFALFSQKIKLPTTKRVQHRHSPWSLRLQADSQPNLSIYCLCLYRSERRDYSNDKLKWQYR